MSQNSLVMRTSVSRAFSRDIVDGHSFILPSTVSLRESKAEHVLLSVVGTHDDRGDFVNNLRVVVQYFDNDTGMPTAIDVSDGISTHYTRLLKEACPEQEDFVRRLLPRFVDKVAYWEPALSQSEREARARSLLASLYAGLPGDEHTDPLGTGANIADLDSTHWFELVHGQLPSTPVNLNSLCQSIAGVELTTLYEPLSLSFTSGPAITTVNGPAPIPRADRNDVGATLTRGGFTAELLIVYDNPLSDEIQDIIQQLSELGEDVDLLKEDVDLLFASISQINANLSTALEAYDGVKDATNGITIRVKEVQNRLRENTGILRGIENRI